ncbi:MAG: hemerythrin domain-containing protein [Bacillota bacterium]|jgi:hemerythrin-like domain-containing protein|nr:hemerythrin domain-containing protein [Clostridia bacterium]
MTEAIDLLKEEHQLVKRVLQVLRKKCWQVVKEGVVNYRDFEDILDFLKNYVDRQHHGKEEDILFDLMGRELGDEIGSGPVTGMLIEHDLGRQYVSGLENSLKQHEKGDEEAVLDIIANSISYTHLLHNHIEREDMILFELARRSLSDQAKEELNRRMSQAMKEKTASDSQEKYRQKVEKWEGALP